MSASNGSAKKERNDKGNAFAKIVARLGFLKTSYKTLILIAIVVIVSVAGSAAVSMMLSSSDSEVYLPSLGTIKTIGVETYKDINGAVKQESLSWNEIKIEKLDWNKITMEPVSTTVYVKSVSNFRVTMDIFLTDWSPVQISDYLTVSWDYDGATMDPDEIIPVTLTLSASSSDAFIDYILENEIQRFDVSIHFVATE